MISVLALSRFFQIGKTLYPLPNFASDPSFMPPMLSSSSAHRYDCTAFWKNNSSFAAASVSLSDNRARTAVPRDRPVAWFEQKLRSPASRQARSWRRAVFTVHLSSLIHLHVVDLRDGTDSLIRHHNRSTLTFTLATSRTLP